MRACRGEGSSLTLAGKHGQITATYNDLLLLTLADG
jgi:hypothetical protein